MTSLLAELKANPIIGQVPEHQLEWLIAHSEVVSHEAGAMIFEPGMPSDEMFIVLDGRIRIWLEQNGSTREVGRMEGGDITGLLPYSRLKSARATAVVMEPARILTTHRDQFPEMIRDQYELTEALVHEMANRIRSFTTMRAQNEKLVSLGKLSAGLAHELNNPSSAVVRVAKDLKEHLGYQPESFKQVISIRMTEQQVDDVNGRLFSKIQGGVQSLSLMERNARESDLEDWLDDHGFSVGSDALEALVDYGFEEEDLEYVRENVPDKDIAPVLNWVGNVLTTEKLVGEIHDASQRIHDLVTSIKSYSHMDQDQDRGEVDIREGIRSTKRMLDHKFRRGRVDFVEEYAEPFPKIHANPGELNQVWTNLLDNALDALEGTENASITIKAVIDGPCLCVSLIDNGPGIPKEVQSQIFDPFFTTKEMGKGTGVGLDVVRRIVESHKASIDVRSEPGRTEFIIWFPLE